MIADPVTSFHNVRIGSARPRSPATCATPRRRSRPAGGSRRRSPCRASISPSCRTYRVSSEPPAISTSASFSMRAASATAVRRARAASRRASCRTARPGRRGARHLDLAGANARVSGRIAPDGSGRIAGKVTAKRAAPLVDLLGRVWVGGVSRLVPRFLREGELDLDIVAERTAGPQGASDPAPPQDDCAWDRRGWAVRGGRDLGRGATERLGVRLATDNTGRWVEQARRLPPAPAVESRPQAASRVRPDSSTSRSTAMSAALAIRTARPSRSGRAMMWSTRGEAAISTARSDAVPRAYRGGSPRPGPPVPAAAAPRSRAGGRRLASRPLGPHRGRGRAGAASRPFPLRRIRRGHARPPVARLGSPPHSHSTRAGPAARSLWSTARFGASPGRSLAAGRRLRAGAPSRSRVAALAARMRTSP